MLPFQGSQRPFLVDMEQVRVSNASNVTVTPYALPVCMTQHHIPVCTGGGGAAPGVSVHAGGPQPTWSFPPCSVHIPACGMQHHLPACISHHQVPLAHAIAPPPPPPPHLVAPPPPPPPPPHFHHHHHHHQHHQHHHHQHHQHQSNPSLQHQTQQNHPQHHHQQQQNHPVVTSYQHQQQQHQQQQQQHQQQHHHQHQQPSQPQHAPPQPPPSLPGAGSQHHHIVSQSHVTPATHFVSAMPTLHRVQDELMAEPRFPYLNIPHMATQQPSARHQPPPPPPILVHDHIVHAIPHEFFGTLSRYRRVSSTRQRWRTIHPPPPPYPGFLLHFLAMLGRPPLTQYRMSLHNLHEDGADLDNYEALLNLADRLGEAKPRGLTKCDIDLLPCYRFNQEIRRSLLDQTSCVICMCDFESRQLLRALPCCHEFHARCVDKWLKANRTCPICRADATERMKAESE